MKLITYLLFIIDLNTIKVCVSMFIKTKQHKQQLF